MYSRFWRDEEGLATVEYAILLALLAAGGIAVWHALGGQIKTGVSNANTSFASVNGDSGGTSSSPGVVGTAFAKQPYGGQ